MNEVQRRTLKVIGKHLKKDPSDIKPEHRFNEDLNTDSLARVELIMAIEEEFKIEISDKVAGKFKIVGDAIKFIESKSA